MYQHPGQLFQQNQEGEEYALLTRKSSPLLPSLLSTSEQQNLTLSSSSTTKSSVSIPRAARSSMFFASRAVANTRKPFRWNSRASALPIPPGEHLVQITKAISGAHRNDQNSRCNKMFGYPVINTDLRSSRSVVISITQYRCTKASR